jgi:alpha-beta hydrolase superfamily lysophospholipase
VRQWHRDFLDGYESTDLPLPDVAPAASEPADVELVATLIRRTPAERYRRAILYVHGWNDYFFQTHLADHLTDLGFDFYAIDLRRYGRSLRRGHLHGFITDLDDYGVELAAAADVIAENHDQLVLVGHSTGGLIASLWAGKNPGSIDGLILNAPWLDFQGLAMIRTLGSPVIDALGSSLPTSVLKLPDSGLTARTLHISLGGEWDYDLDLKTTPSAPIRVGWLRAILLGHQRVAAGLHIEVPILVLASSTHELARRWHEGLRTVDTVLDVDKIARRATQLGRCVTIVRIDEALHDVILSAPNVRKIAMDEMSRWIDGYVQHPHTGVSGLHG